MFEYAKNISSEISTVWSTTRKYLSYHKQHYYDNDLARSEISYHWLPNLPAADNYRTFSEKRRQQLAGHSGKQKELVVLGRLSEQGVHQKNIPNLLRALFLLSKHSPEVLEDLTINLIGDGDYRDKIIKQIGRLNLRHLFILHKQLHHSEILSLVGRASASILISKYEGHSMFGLENLCIGVPLLSSDNSGITEFIRDGVNGVLVNPDDIYEIANGVKKILNMPLETFDADYYLSQYNFEMLTNRVSDLIDLLIAEV